MPNELTPIEFHAAAKRGFKACEAVYPEAAENDPQTAITDLLADLLALAFQGAMKNTSNDEYDAAQEARDLMDRAWDHFEAEAPEGGPVDITIRPEET
jgi:hypothetical protein